jgi:pimeloyl-ACP methyl ester carboxylesterase
MGHWVRGGLAATLLALIAAAAPASAGTGSLYNGPSPRPGPDILYSSFNAPVDAPQLQNSGVWKADPILISGASAYRDGEFLYQDWLFDDHGANGGQRDGNDPRTGDTFGVPNGTYTYPRDKRYVENAADLVELRVKPLAGATALRVTLNSLTDPDLVAITFAIGNSPVPRPYPHGANATGPAQLFLTVHGTSAELIDAATGQPARGGELPTVSVDARRRQIEVRIDHGMWNPGTGTVRLAAGVGLWNKANGRYLIPEQDSSPTAPGGAGNLPAPTAFFNAAFRNDEPLPDVGDLERDLLDTAWWREQQQGHALAAGDMGAFHADIDFGKLASGAGDESKVPKDGPMNRIVASRFETQQGADHSKICDDTIPAENRCIGEYRSRLQPYAIYIPKKPPPPGGYGLTLLLHSHAAMYNQFLGSRNQSQFGERGPGSIVITPAGRGVDGWSWDHASADLFEVWADVARRFSLDPEWTAIAGYSMGGYSTFKLAVQYPDLFARAQPTVGPPGVGLWAPPGEASGGRWTNTFHQVASLRHVPFLMWVAASDELVPYSGTRMQADRFDALGYRYAFETFAPAEHLTLAFADQYERAAEFLGTAKVDRNPAHITYVVNPKMDFGEADGPVDHAYWLSGLRLRDGSGPAPLGTVDVRSQAFGVGDPVPSAKQVGGGVNSGGNPPVAAIGYSSEFRTWGPPPATPKANVLDIDATNIRAMSIDVARARVDCGVTLKVKTDGPLTIALEGCDAVATLDRAGEIRGTCRDRVAPISRIDRRSAQMTGGRIVMRGRASDSGCRGGAQQAARSGRVARVQLSVARVERNGCRFLKRNGKLTGRRNCRRPVLLLARGGERWDLSVRAKLPAGGYRVISRAYDASGNKERPRTGRNMVGRRF